MFESEIISTKEQYEKYYKERFIYDKELSDIVQIMQNNDKYKILILGAPGSGKSTLLHYINPSTAHEKDMGIVYGYNFRNNNYDFLMPKDGPLLIDGLDEMQDSYRLLHFLNEKNCDRLICTSRPHISLDMSYFTHVINLNPLTTNMIEKFINKMDLDIRQLHPLLADLHINNRPITPKDILRFVIANVDDSNIQEFYSRYPYLSFQYGKGIDFSSDIIQSERKVIVPSKEIIKSVTIFDNTLLKKAVDDPRVIHSFSSREFEEMVCELLDKQGYNVKLTKQTRDGGKDIIVVQKSILGEFCIFVECKKYDTTRPISVGLVRELYGTVMAENATAGMMITTSYFTKDAKEYTEKIKHRLTLKDYNDLVQELNNING